MKTSNPTRETLTQSPPIQIRRVVERGEERLPGQGVKFDSALAILEGGDQIQAAINANPEIGGLFFVNPALVLQELGFELTEEVKEHVNHALASGGQVIDELAALEGVIRKALSDPDGKWKLLAPKHLADILFDVLLVEPRVLEGAQVPYRSPASSPRLAALEKRAAKPTRKLRLPDTAQGKARDKIKGVSFAFSGWKPSVRFVDVDAEVPDLPRAKSRPEAVKPEELFFYLRDHTLVRKLLEYAMARDKLLLFRSDKHYRSVRDGELSSPWRTWIRAVRYP